MILVAPWLCVLLAQPPAPPLSGTVAGPDGRPVDGAEVVLAGPADPSRARTDAEGRFAIDRPARPAVGRTGFWFLWVLKPGYRLACTRFGDRLPDEPVRVVLGPPARAEVHVEGPDGAPIAGARVRVEQFGTTFLNLPEELEDRIEAKTDKDGLAVIETVANEDVVYIDVVTEAFGVQGRRFQPPSARPRRIQLRPSASLEGRVVADDPAMAKGWQVSAWTRVGDQWSRNPETTGYARATTDEKGRFAFPVLAPGSLQLVLKPPRDLAVLPRLPKAMTVHEAKKNVVEIPLVRVATVTGLVVERGTRRPIPDVEAGFWPKAGGMIVTEKTDAQGRFTYRVLPGVAMNFRLSNPPPTHAQGPGPYSKEFTVPEGKERFELEPSELIPAAPPLRYVVRDEAGRPAAGAAITGQSGSRHMPKTTDARGEFAIAGLAPGTEVQVEVGLGDRMTDGPAKAVAGRTDPVPVTIVPGVAARIAGRVVRPGGAPVSGARVKFEYRDTATGPGHFRFPQQFWFNGWVEIQTGPDGTFRTPEVVYRKAREFRAKVEANGLLPGETDWASTEGGDLLTFPDLVLRPLQGPRPIAGRVLDRQGKGIPGASVLQRIDGPKVTTNSEGRFRFVEVPGGAVFLFAEKDGYRFGGAIVDPSEESVEIRLTRVDEPPPPLPKSRPPLSRAEERALAREWLGPVVVAARRGTLGNLGQSFLPVLARVDPDRVLGMMEDRVVVPTPQILEAVVLAQFEDDPAAAVATIEGDRDPAARAGYLLAIADALPEADRDRRIEWIDRAQAEARRVENKDVRLGLLARVADGWLDLGLVDRARPILREGRAIIATLPKDRHSAAAVPFAQVLAAIDLRTARPILEARVMSGVSGDIAGMIARQLVGAAVRLAAFDPAAAESLVPESLPRNYWDSEGDLLRICARMARADLPRARKFLDSIERRTGPEPNRWPPPRPIGLGLMAIERAEIDPAGARALLDEAFDQLRALEIANRDSNVTVGSTPLTAAASIVMAALLPAVERVDPDRLAERLWLAAACLPPRSDVPWLQYQRPPVVVAMLVSRYDRAMADALIAPVLDRLPAILADAGNVQFGGDAGIIGALAVHDPRALAALLKALPASARKGPDPKREAQWYLPSLDLQVRQIGAELLGLPVDQRIRYSLGRDSELGVFVRGH